MRVCCIVEIATVTLIDIIPLNAVYRVLYSVQEPTLPVYLQRTWQLNSSQVGLVFFSAALPAMLGQSPYWKITCDK